MQTVGHRASVNAHGLPWTTIQFARFGVSSILVVQHINVVANSFIGVPCFGVLAIDVVVWGFIL